MVFPRRSLSSQILPEKKICGILQRERREKNSSTGKKYPASARRASPSALTQRVILFFRGFPHSRQKKKWRVQKPFLRKNCRHLSNLFAIPTATTMTALSQLLEMPDTRRPSPQKEGSCI